MSNSKRLPVFSLIVRELLTTKGHERVPEPAAVMCDQQHVDAYQKASQSTGAFCGHHYFLLNELVRRIRPGTTVVDLGTGTGDLLIEIAALYPTTQFIGVDLSAEALAKGKETLLQAGLNNVKFLQSDMCMIDSIRSGSVDFVMSTMALHHLPSTEHLQATLGEVDRVLKPHGEFFVIDFTRMKNRKNVDVIVNAIAGSADPEFKRDFHDSMLAAFSLSDFRAACAALPKRNIIVSRTPVSSMVVLHTGRSLTQVPKPISSHLSALWSQLPGEQKFSSLAVRSLLGPRFW